MLLSAVLKGFTTGSGLIMAIGPQNAFVIQQGLKKNNLLFTALLCGLFDAILITLGVAGVSALLNLHPMLIFATKWFGAIFLMAYGLLSFHCAIYSKKALSSSLENNTQSKRRIFLMLAALAFHCAIYSKKALSSSLENNTQSKRRIFLMLAALAFLNPHAYLDTVVLLGSIAAQQPEHLNYFFGLGAILSSFLWFFTIGYGAKLLSPLFEKEYPWRIIHIGTGILMIVIAINCIFR